MGWGGVSGGLQGRSNSVSQVDGVSDMHQPAGFVVLWEEGSEKGQWPLLTLIPDTSAYPSMPLVPFNLPPHWWSSQWVWVGESMCGFIKRNCLGFHKFLPPTQSLLVFAARSCGDLSSWHWNLRLRGLVWGWDSLLLRYPFQIFIPHTWVWCQPVLHLHPSYQSGWMWFL